jgi:hypothetical protein
MKMMTLMILWIEIEESESPKELIEDALDTALESDFIY